MAGAQYIPPNRLMTDSKVGDAWIEKAARDNPTIMLPGEGRNISSGPVRLSFVQQLWEPKAPMGNPQGTPKYSVVALYTPFSDMNVYYSEYYRIANEMFADHYSAAAGSYVGLENPFHPAAEKSHKFAGYTPGCIYMNHSGANKPAIVDARHNPITDVSRVYPGVWAIIVTNAYGYGKTPPRPKKGISFGIRAVMIIGDDVNIAGTSVDPREVFAGVNVVPPAVAPSALAGLVPPVPGQVPGAPPMSGMMTPPGGFQPPGPPMGFQTGAPPNPLHMAMRGTQPAADDPYDISSIS